MLAPAVVTICAVFLAAVCVPTLKKWVAAVQSWGEAMLQVVRSMELDQSELLQAVKLEHSELKQALNEMKAVLNEGQAQHSAAVLLKMQGQLEQTQSTATAVVNLERRFMQLHLTGAETSRLVSCLLHEFQPFGAIDTWRAEHCMRVLLELQACWKRSMALKGQPVSIETWNAVVECGIQRALDEQEVAELNCHGEMVLLQDKIDFWRANIALAVGLPAVPNFLELQATLQHHPTGHQPGGFDAHGDLFGWRHIDVTNWMQAHPGANPFEA